MLSSISSTIKGATNTHSAVASETGLVDITGLQWVLLNYHSTYVFGTHKVKQTVSKLECVKFKYALAMSIYFVATLVIYMHIHSHIVLSRLHVRMYVHM